MFFTDEETPSRPLLQSKQNLKAAKQNKPRRVYPKKEKKVKLNPVEEVMKDPLPEDLEARQEAVLNETMTSVKDLETPAAPELFDESGRTEAPGVPFSQTFLLSEDREILQPSQLLEPKRFPITSYEHLYTRSPFLHNSVRRDVLSTGITILPNYH